MSPLPLFSDRDHQTWQNLFARQSPLRDQQLIPEFSQGLKKLNIEGSAIPDLQEVNERLGSISGWQGVYTRGFVELEEFFKMLTERKFPVGSFIRDPKDLSYTPEPDVFHDLYGHLPFYTIPAYAKFCQEFGERALRYADSLQILTEFQRLFWFSVEFGLVHTAHGRRIFGAGIASSFQECAYVLSPAPRVHEYEAGRVRAQDFRIDILQEDLFIFHSLDQLFDCLDEFEAPYRAR